MTSSYRPRSWTLLVSVVLHAVGIAVLLTLPSAEPPRARPVRIALIAPLRFHPALAVDPAPAAPKRSLRPTIRHVPRSFHLPDPSPRPARPQLTLILPDPPSLGPSNILPPAPGIPGVAELPPAPVVRPAGFPAVETSKSAPTRRVPAHSQAFDAVTAASDKIAPRKIASADFGDASVAAAGAHPSQNPTCDLLGGRNPIQAASGLYRGSAAPADRRRSAARSAVWSLGRRSRPARDAGIGARAG